MRVLISEVVLKMGEIFVFIKLFNYFFGKIIYFDFFFKICIKYFYIIYFFKVNLFLYVLLVCCMGVGIEFYNLLFLIFDF